jgi:hypothetical protein
MNLTNIDKLYTFDPTLDFNYLEDIEALLQNSNSSEEEREHALVQLDHMLGYCEIINEKLVNVSKLVN